MLTFLNKNQIVVIYLLFKDVSVLASFNICLSVYFALFNTKFYTTKNEGHKSIFKKKKL